MGAPETVSEAADGVIITAKKENSNGFVSDIRKTVRPRWVCWDLRIL